MRVYTVILGPDLNDLYTYRRCSLESQVERKVWQDGSATSSDVWSGGDGVVEKAGGRTWGHAAENVEVCPGRYKDGQNQERSDQRDSACKEVRRQGARGEVEVVWTRPTNRGRVHREKDAEDVGRRRRRPKNYIDVLIELTKLPTIIMRK